ncbi:Uncharacterised protein [uncultured archaeon]|nr:Uncharacterised protein [uncultured archaeon]
MPHTILNMSSNVSMNKGPTLMSILIILMFSAITSAMPTVYNIDGNVYDSSGNPLTGAVVSAWINGTLRANSTATNLSPGYESYYNLDIQGDTQEANNKETVTFKVNGRQAEETIIFKINGNEDNYAIHVTGISPQATSTTTLQNTATTSTTTTIHTENEATTTTKLTQTTKTTLKSTTTTILPPTTQPEPQTPLETTTTTTAIENTPSTTEETATTTSTLKPAQQPTTQINLCSDGIQNQGEEGIDCAGPCPNPCGNKETTKSESPSNTNLIIGILLIAAVFLFALLLLAVILLKLKARKPRKR